MMHGIMTGLGWFVIYAEARGEFRAVISLSAIGIEAYCPVGKRRVHRRGESDAYYPLFSRYIFVRLNPLDGEARSAISQARGVVRLLANDGIPVRVPDRAVEELRSAQHMGLFDERRVLEQKLTPGTLVRIIKGPFAEFVAEVVKLRGKKRVEILLSLFGRPMQTNLELDAIRQLGMAS